MKKNTKINKHLETILKKQCKMVGADFDKIDFEKNDWYWSYEWKEDKQEKFRQWIISYMKTNKEARHSLMRIPSNNPRFIEKFANGLIFQYGWKQS